MAKKIADEPKLLHRMCDLTSEPKRMLPPIKGYEKEPLVTLEQAVKPLLPFIPDIEEMVWTVKQNCQQPQNQLSPDESASIMLYTLEWMPKQHSLYFILNKTLRSLKREDLVHWFLFLRLFIFALSKFPSTTHRNIYRGIKMDVSDEFPKGKTFIWWGFSSCSSSIEVLEQFLGQSGHRTIFNIECDSAKDISQHSFYENEDEILMYPARQFQVISSFDSGNQLKIIHLKEIQPPFSLIHIPQTSLTTVNQMKEIEPSFSHIHISQTSSTNIYQNKQLQQLIDECENKSEVNLREQNLTDEDIEIVVKEAIINKQCMELNLSNNKITSAGVSIIAEALNNNTTLEQLCLDDNRLCDEGIHSLTKTFSLDNCKLKLLSLQNTGLKDKGAEYLAEMLKTNTTLQGLLLGSNEISDRGVEFLANALTHRNNTLLLLAFRRNKLITDSSIDVIVTMLKHNQVLKELYMSSCNLSENGKEKLRQTARLKKGFQLFV